MTPQPSNRRHEAERICYEKDSNKMMELVFELDRLLECED